MPAISFLPAILLLAVQATSGVFAGDARQAQNALMIQRHYPAVSLARGEEGSVGFRIVLEPTGRIRSCVVTRSSGFAALDTATCDLMIDNARFKPVIGDGGRRGVSRHEGVLNWTLPAGMVRPAVAPVSVAVRKSEEIICKRQPKPDSNYILMKVCLSPTDWRRTLNYARAQTNLFQGNGYIP